MIRRDIHATAVIDVQGRAELPTTTVMEPFSVIFIGAEGRLQLGARNILYPHVSIRIDQGWLRTGSDVSFGPGVAINEPRAGIEIGDHCLIGGGCRLCGGNHGMETADGPMRYQATRNGPILLEDDVWLGMRVTVLPDVRIGTGAIVAAGAVVTREIPAYAVAAGIPARVIRERRPDETPAGRSPGDRRPGSAMPEDEPPAG